jgi:5-hydroxyisourate hydrolase-like protein (transthyretin family)
MIAVLSLALFMIPPAITQAGTGVVSGTIKDAAGEPQQGVRVAARAVPAPGDARAADVLVTIGETNESGNYVLQVPQGRYYIIAGRVDRPAYYPNAASPDQATVVAITPGSKTTGIDFEVFLLSGVIHDAAGRPQAGVRVSAVDASATPRCANTENIETETDTEGRYRLAVLSGEYLLAAERWNKRTFYRKTESRETATSISTNNREDTSGLDIEVPEDPASRPPGRDGQLYAAAMQNATRGCFPAARLQFLTLVTTYPDSALASDARFEYAESFYLEGSPQALKDAYQEFSMYIRLFPGAPRIPQARQRLLEIEQKTR